MAYDQLHRFTFENLDIRGELVVLEKSWQAISASDDYPPAVRRVLGESLAAVALLAATIKYEGSLILQIQGEGPLRTLVVQATDKGDLRGLARTGGEVTDTGLQAMFGRGQMVITLSSPGREPHQSIVGLQEDRLQEVLEHYFLNSEQLASRFWLFTSESRVAGLFLQQLPAQTPSLEDWERVGMLAATTTAGEILTLPPEEMLHRLFHEENVRLFEPESLRFRCSCSREKISSTLYSLGRHQLEDILEEKGQIDVDCEFCNTRYSFLPGDINALFTIDDDDRQLH